MKLNEAILNEKKSAAAEYKKRRSAATKELKEIEKKLKGMDARQKKDPENWGFVGSLGNALKNLKELSAELGGGADNESAYNAANRGSTTGGTRGQDPDGQGSPNPGGHQKGKATPGQRWLEPNPKNLY